MEEVQQILDDLLEEVKEYKSLNKAYVEIISHAKSYQNISKSHFDSIATLIQKLSLTTEKIDSKANELLNTIDSSHNDLVELNTSYLNIASTIQETYASNIDDFKSQLDSNVKIFNKSHVEMQISLQAIISKFENDIASDNKRLFNSMQAEVSKFSDVYNQELHQINTKIKNEIASNFIDLQSRLNSTLNNQQIANRKDLIIGFTILVIFCSLIVFKLFS